jgi:sporulation protein YlmC with PRC-barrel domain
VTAETGPVPTPTAVSLRSLLGMKVVSRTTAAGLGEMTGALVDAPSRRIVAWCVGKGRHARIVEHPHLSGVGAAAVVVEDESFLRPPDTDAEKALAKGRLGLISAPLLTVTGNSAGEVYDADLDPATGGLYWLRSATATIPADRLVGYGSFAAVITGL